MEYLDCKRSFHMQTNSPEGPMKGVGTRNTSKQQYIPAAQHIFQRIPPLKVLLGLPIALPGRPEELHGTCSPISATVGLLVLQGNGPKKG